jgi:hypothetical protein
MNDEYTILDHIVQQFTSQIELLPFNSGYELERGYIMLYDFNQEFQSKKNIAQISISDGNIKVGLHYHTYGSNFTWTSDYTYSLADPSSIESAIQKLQNRMGYLLTFRR